MPPLPPKEPYYAELHSSEDPERFFPLYKNDRYRLEGERLLNDHIINFHLAALVEALPVDKRRRVGTVASNALANFGTPRATMQAGFIRDRYFRDLLFEKDLLLVPVNYDHHWTLLVFYNFSRRLVGAATGIVFYLDPLGNENELPPGLEDEVGVFIKAQAERYTAANKDKPDAQDLAWVGEPLARARYNSFTRTFTLAQVSNYECGYYILQYAAAFIKKLDTNKITMAYRYPQSQLIVAHVTPRYMVNKIPKIRSMILGEIEQNLV